MTGGRGGRGGLWRQRWWARIAGYARPFWPRLLLLLAAQLALAGLTALAPWPAKLIIDHVLTGEPLPEPWRWLGLLPGASSRTGLLVVLAVATIVVFLLRQVVLAVQRVHQVATGRRMSYDLTQDALQQVQRQSLIGLQRHRRGDLLSRIVQDAGCVEQLVFGVGLAAAASLAELGVMGGVMLGLSPLLAVASLAVLAPLAWQVARFARPMTSWSAAEAAGEGTVVADAERVLSMLPDVQAFTAEEREADAFRRVVSHWWRSGVRLQQIMVRFEFGITVVTAAGAAVVLGIGGLLVMRGRVSVGDLVVFTTYLAALQAPVTALVYLSATWAQARAGADRVLEVWGEDTAIVEPASPVAFPPVDPRGARVELRGVTVGYEPGRPVLHEVDLAVQPGQTVALVGPSGAGKTTLVSLLPRFLDPWQGEVRIDGVDLRQARLRDVRRRVALVRQDPILLPASVADNIAYGRPDATREQIEAAAADAGAAEFIDRLADGYDTVLGEDGATLSGGQRARLAIARAFLKDAPLLILDEPTAALDARTVALLVDAIARLTRDRTVLVIAHRPTTIHRADIVLTLDHGRITSTDTHQPTGATP